MKKIAYTILTVLLINVFNLYALDVANGNTAQVDGNDSEWNSSHFLTNMHRAWKTSKDVLSKAYAMYDCENEVLYFRIVKAVSDYPIIVDSNGNDVYIKSGNSKLVSSANEGNSGYPTFAWINKSGSYADGWEAAVKVEPGTLTNMAIHNNVMDNSGSQTSGLRKFDITLTCEPATSLDVQFTAFDVTIENNRVILKWDVVEENGHAGYNVLRIDHDGNTTQVNEQLISPVFLGTMAEHTYEIIDELNETSNYTYKIEAINTNGSIEYSEPVVVTFGTTAVQDTESVPAEFVLNQNYPNPFNPMTTIAYTLPKAAHTRLVIFDALGREVAELVNEMQAAGSYDITWNAAHADMSLASGVYFYRLTAGDFSQTFRMMLVK